MYALNESVPLLLVIKLFSCVSDFVAPLATPLRIGSASIEYWDLQICLQISKRRTLFEDGQNLQRRTVLAKGRPLFHLIYSVIKTLNQCTTLVLGISMQLTYLITENVGPETYENAEQP
ncbi:hypothetical protein AVEN_198839-1 [Araneus ventricosus]|uniref:Uncharacterized protein n=1 Tax=Araneus ventricosus TaxID=182803 RepID=A0A4Y2JCZ0_ARAVE|nr:hypothetical protein AVEN_198839-1 [Araneus ventricosus]